MVDEQEVEAYLEGESDELNTAQEQEVKQEDEEESEEAISDLGVTDFDESGDSAGKLSELVNGLAYADNDVANEFIGELNQAVTDIAMDMGLVDEEDVPEDLK
jgi:hypothetical protein